VEVNQDWLIIELMICVLAFLNFDIGKKANAKFEGY
jgi:hypothetical protein